MTALFNLRPIFSSRPFGETKPRVVNPLSASSSKGFPIIPMKSHPTGPLSVVSSASPVTSSSASAVAAANKRLPILLFDVMGTIVRDPFYEDVPAFFGLNWLKSSLKMEDNLTWKVSVDRMQAQVVSLPVMDILFMFSWYCHWS